MLWKFIQREFETFWQACVGGGVVWGTILFATPNLLAGFVLSYALKIFGAAVLAFVTGLAAVLAKDFYEHKLKHRIFKNKSKENGSTQSDKEKRA